MSTKPVISLRIPKLLSSIFVFMLALPLMAQQAEVFKLIPLVSLEAQVNKSARKGSLLAVVDPRSFLELDGFELTLDGMKFRFMAKDIRQNVAIIDKQKLVEGGLAEKIPARLIPSMKYSSLGIIEESYFAVDSFSALSEHGVEEYIKDFTEGSTKRFHITSYKLQIQTYKSVGLSTLIFKPTVVTTSIVVSNIWDALEDKRHIVVTSNYGDLAKGLFIEEISFQANVDIVSVNPSFELKEAVMVKKAFDVDRFSASVPEQESEHTLEFTTDLQEFGFLEGSKKAPKPSCAESRKQQNQKILSGACQ